MDVHKKSLKILKG